MTAPLEESTAEPTPAEIDALFGARLVSTMNALLATRFADVVFDVARAGQWTLHIAGTSMHVTRGGVRRPDVTIRTDPTTLAAILETRESGAVAFLDGRITVRGDLSLGLQLDGAFAGERPPTHPRTGLVTPLGVRTTYLEAGEPDAPPVVLLHGLGATNASMLPLVRGLATDYRVLAPDFPGFGASAAPRWHYRAADFSRWYTAFVRSVGISRAPIIGNSLGGRVAIEAALTNPEAVDRLVLLCPAPALRALRQFVPVVRLLSPDLSRPMPLPMTHKGVVRGIRSMFADPRRLPDAWYDAGADEFLRVMRGAGHRRAFFASLRQIYLEPPFGPRGFWPRLEQLHQPSLFVWGERDRLVPWAFARHVSQALPDAQSVVLPDCGHVPQYELPEETLTMTREFLAA